MTSRRCTRCILSERSVGISFDDKGRCNFCTDHSGAELPPMFGEGSEVEAAIQEIFFDIKRNTTARDTYDCLALFSGGKDSLMALWLVSQIYNLRTLAVTLDNGFMTESALNNAAVTTRKLGVDWQVVPAKTSPAIFHRFLRTELRKKVSICAVCNGVRSEFFEAAFSLAKSNNIGVIVDGRSKQSGEQLQSWPGLFSQKKRVSEFLGAHRSEFKLTENFEMCSPQDHEVTWISPWLYLRRNIEENLQLLERCAGWKRPARTWPRGSTNCDLSVLDGYLYHRYQIPDNPYEHELSMEIRHGEITRDHALETIRSPVDESLVREIVSRFELDIDDL